mmetsp:Transcript_20620/g.62920  ORF Transcript_20620/g.62920 Transcript_20620/m.62920 type:complete len:213 (+) Transcript_20620:227-865(+)
MAGNLPPRSSKPACLASMGPQACRHRARLARLLHQRVLIRRYMMQIRVSGSLALLHGAFDMVQICLCPKWRTCVPFVWTSTSRAFAIDVGHTIKDASSDMTKSKGRGKSSSQQRPFLRRSCSSGWRHKAFCTRPARIRSRKSPRRPSNGRKVGKPRLRQRRKLPPTCRLQWSKLQQELAKMLHKRLWVPVHRFLLDGKRRRRRTGASITTIQ